MHRRENQGFPVYFKKIAAQIEEIQFPQLIGSDGEDDLDEGEQNQGGVDDGGDLDEEDDDEEAKKDKKLSREAARRRRENIALRKQLEELQAEREADALSRKSKLEQAQHKLKEAQDASKSMGDANRRLLLENAVLKDSKRTWHDSSAAIALLDTSLIEIDPVSGTIEGIEDALADLAKDKPFLLKSGNGRQGNGSSGSNPQGGAGEKVTPQQRQAELKRKWKLA